MDVVEHDHISPDSDVEIAFGSLGEKNERVMNFVASKA